MVPSTVGALKTAPQRGAEQGERLRDPPQNLITPALTAVGWELSRHAPNRPSDSAIRTTVTGTHYEHMPSRKITQPCAYLARLVDLASFGRLMLLC